LTSETRFDFDEDYVMDGLEEFNEQEVNDLPLIDAVEITDSF
jgi:hypothetical protein